MALDQPLSREQVYHAVDSERDYQDRMWAENNPANAVKLTIGEELLLLEEYIAKARSRWTTEPRPEVGALEFVRKIAGVAVRCMESHGAPIRE